ncbi:MAG: carboxymuconolactone decarboxylase family protein [Leptospiraceae bacterium]|nr:carboxymuconolactone decarboxylase family protein [Leptospiraceae bacterium]
MKAFRRRVYSPSEFIRDLFRVICDAGMALRVGLGDALPHSFRERLYLAVTAVNGCRYCSYLHSRTALRAGLSQAEVNLLLGGAVDSVPLHEAKALLYAQCWAENNGRVDAEARSVLMEEYGQKRFRAIEMALLLIRVGSLSGNTFDYYLYRISGGHLGLSEKDALNG